MTKRIGLLLLLAAALVASCGRKGSMRELSIVPEPLFEVRREGSFTLHSNPRVSVAGVGQNSATVRYIMQSLRHSKMRPRLVPTSRNSDIAITLYDTVNPELADEGYLLEVRSSGITLRANTEHGLFYGFQSLLQMLPPDVTVTSYSAIVLPECTVLDRPRFAWRGMQLDASHLAFSTKAIKRWIDVASAYKMNRLWLNLPSADAAYSEAELLSLADYAAEHHVGVVPMLCDSLADSAMLALFGCDAALLPEVCLTHRGGLDSARAGMRVAMSPEACFNMAVYQADPRYQPGAEPGLSTLQTTYSYEPAPLGTNIHVEANILGGLCRMSTARMDSDRQAEYMLLPRMLAVSECLWSGRDNKDWTRFRRKVEDQKDRLCVKGYTYCEGSFTPSFTTRRVDDQVANVAITTEVPNTYIFYTTDLSTPTRRSAIYMGPINLTRGTHIKILPVYKDQERDSVYEYVIK